MTLLAKSDFFRATIYHNLAARVATFWSKVDHSVGVLGRKGMQTRMELPVV